MDNNDNDLSWLLFKISGYCFEQIITFLINLIKFKFVIDSDKEYKGRILPEKLKETLVF